ncbi:hypothetical protein J6590_085147 [Homalodisca vitripennis]|nr:hypothetical protein J6590_085147 [Homalodisca vitripennis]
MGDSDDEYGDRKRRDKFRGERTESYRSGEGRREDRRRDEWIERDTWGGGRSRARGDYRGTVRERYSPARQHDFSPPPKRIRTEWLPLRIITIPSAGRPPLELKKNYLDGAVLVTERFRDTNFELRLAVTEPFRDTRPMVLIEDPPNYEIQADFLSAKVVETVNIIEIIEYQTKHYEEDRRMPYTDTSYNYSSSWGQETQAPYSNNNQRTEQVETQPPMLSLKAFLQSQDDNISDEEAIRKYNEYKLEFRRQQLNEFFVAHKEEEWFKLKYHPEESIKRKEEQSDALKRRVEVFMEFLDNGRLDKVTVDAEQSEQLIKLLDAAVIRLEGGTDLDLEILDEVPVPAPTPAQPTSDDDTKPIIKKEPVDDDEKEKEAADGEVTEEGESVIKKTEDGNKEEDEKVTVIKSQDSPESSLTTPKESADEKNMSSIDSLSRASLFITRLMTNNFEHITSVNLIYLYKVIITPPIQPLYMEYTYRRLYKFSVHCY